MDTLKLNDYIKRLGAFNRVLVRVGDGYADAFEKLKNAGFITFASNRQIDVMALMSEAKQALVNGDIPVLQNNVKTVTLVLVDFFQEYSARGTNAHQVELYEEFSVAFNYYEMMVQEYVWQRELSPIELRLETLPYDIMQICTLSQNELIRPEDCLDEVIYGLEQDVNTRNAKLASLTERLKLAHEIGEKLNHVCNIDQRKTFQGQFAGPLKRLMTRHVPKDWQEFIKSKGYLNSPEGHKRMLESHINDVFALKQHYTQLVTNLAEYRNSLVTSVAEFMREKVATGFYSTKDTLIRTLMQTLGDEPEMPHPPDNLKIKEVLENYNASTNFSSKLFQYIYAALATMAVFIPLTSVVGVQAACSIVIGCLLVGLAAVSVYQHFCHQKAFCNVRSNGQLDPVAADYIVRNSPSSNAVMEAHACREMSEVLAQPREEGSLVQTAR